jgi:hypothetical protein
LNTPRYTPPYVPPPQESDTPPVGHDIFTDPALAQTVAEDPFIRWLKQSWRTLAVIVAAVVAGAYVVSTLRETHHASLERSADLYARVRADFEAYTVAHAAARSGRETAGQAGEEGEQKRVEAERAAEAVRVRLEQGIAALGDTKEPYASIALIYSDLLAKLEGGAQGASPALAGGDAFFSEMHRFVRARALLNDAATVDSGREQLSSLARDGSYVAVAAVSVLRTIARTPAEQATAEELVQRVRERLPAQASLLSEREDALAEEADG